MRIFLAANTFIILSLGQLKMRTLRFVVHSVRATNHASKTQSRIWRNIWSRSTARLRLQSKSHQVVLSRELRAKPRPRLLQGVPTTQTTKLDFGAKQSKLYIVYLALLLKMYAMTVVSGILIFFKIANNDINLNTKCNISGKSITHVLYVILSCVFPSSKMFLLIS